MMARMLFLCTFMPYCIFATIGLSARKLNIFRFMVKGIGTMSAMKSTISATSRTKTWVRVN